ncbi:MAG: prolipoprotein diacylglyceryl transferase [Candidatus Symbiothrix sp.]|jgi:prolipoprotein diacylglyceryl transferase|nr:prolipoprotein diacylglyceryl transferase [Candidatus Symbiothrix sp.]
MQNKLLYINWNVDPQIFNGFGIGYYNLLFVGGLILCSIIIKRIFESEKISEIIYIKLFYYCLAGIVIGARLGHCLFYQPDYYFQHPFEMIFPFSIENGKFILTGYRGLASHGGVIGMLIAIYFYSKKAKMSFLKTLDYVAIVAPLGSCFIRLGNLMNSEIIGKETDVPWAFIFHRVDSIPRHPAQLYEAIAYLIMFIILWIVYKKKGMSLKTGFYFGLVLLMIFTFRFLIEFVKERQVSFEDEMSLDMGQILSIPFILIGLFFVLRKNDFGSIKNSNK